MKKKKIFNYKSLIPKIILYIYIYMWGQKIWAFRPISNNKPKGPAEEENVRG